jgi:thiol-disulfide isomerase/thioredoxin
LNFQDRFDILVEKRLSDVAEQGYTTVYERSRMKTYLISISPLIVVAIVLLFIVSSLYFYKRNKLPFIYLAVFIMGLITGLGLKNYIVHAQDRTRMAHRANSLLYCVTMIRDGELERGINNLDGEINQCLMASAWNKEIKELPKEILNAWHEAKVYYDKYDVVGYDYNANTSSIRRKLEDVPWSQQEADKRAFEAKYKTGAPQIAPDLDISKWIGPDLSLNKLRGKVVLLDIWGLACKPCIASLPRVQKLHDKFNDKGLTVIAVHGWGGSYESISKFIKQKKYNFAVGIDSGKTVKNYGVIGIPSYYLIDKKGVLVWGPEQEIPSQELIESMLNEFRGDDKRTEIIEAFYADNMTWIMCEGCKNAYQMSLRQYHRTLQENIDPVNMTIRPLSCPKCGEGKCYKAIKCDQCGEMFYEGTVPNTYSDTCPKCKYSKIKKDREEAAR